MKVNNRICKPSMAGIYDVFSITSIKVFGVFILRLSIFSAVFLSSCEKSIQNSPTTNFQYTLPAPIPAITSFDLSYGNHPEQKMDIYLPEGRSKANTKLMILIHGGEWSQGDKSQMQYFIQGFQKDVNDFAFATLNYRLASGPNSLFPAQEEDINLAVQFLLNLADSFRISKKHVLFGESAGGHLALLQAYKYKNSFARAVIALHAPSDLTDMYNNPINAQNRSVLERVTGGTPSSTSLYYSSSPINYLSGQIPATLLFHGSNDAFLDPQQSIRIGNILNQKGINHTIVVFQSESHVFSSSAFEEVFSKSKEFLMHPLLFKD